MVQVLKEILDTSEQHPARPTRAEAEAAVTTLIRWIGEDPQREGLLATPARMVKAYDELFAGYRKDPADVLGRTFEEVSGFNDLVVLRDIDFHSHCEHHILPVIGRAHIAYLPDNRVVGLSKLVRCVEILAHRLQTQEALTAQIADAIATTLRPRAVAVVIEAEHMCMAMRGIRKAGTTTMTQTFHGSFCFDEDARQRALRAMLGQRA